MATALSPIDRPKQLTETRCRIALVGFGTVGSAVARLLHARRDDHSLRLTHVCNRNIARKKVNWISPDVRWTENFGEVLESNADIIVELMGGLEPAHELVRTALRRGKAVVTANKQLIAHFGPGITPSGPRQRTVPGFRRMCCRRRADTLGTARRAGG